MEITLLLQAARGGDSTAMDAVFHQIYPQLKQLAMAQMHFRGGALTLTPTVLVNEVYLRFADSEGLDLVDRRHFMLCAARAMRHIMVDHWRAQSAQRRGGGQQRVTLTGLEDTEAGVALNLIDLDEALNDLEAVDPALRQLVELKFFAGLTMSEIAGLLDSSLRTAKRNWVRARAFLHAQLA